MKLSVLIPVYNEATTLERMLRQVAAVNIDKEIILVDDCSVDGTAEVLKEIDIPGLRVLTHEVNRGKGAAIRTALEAASGDVIIIQDADLEYDPQDYHALLQPILGGEAQVVYGIRDLSGQLPWVRWGNRLLTGLANLVYRSHLQDMETCYKLMTMEVARSLNLESDRFDLDPEMTAKILRQGHEIREVPVWYQPRREKKLSPLRDGLPALLAVLKYRRW